MDVQDQIALFYWVRLGSGVVVVISALMFVWAVLVPGRERSADPVALAQPAE
jgi:nitric oxide reductase subunit B